MTGSQALRLSFALKLHDVVVELDQKGPSGLPPAAVHVDYALTASAPPRSMEQPLAAFALLFGLTRAEGRMLATLLNDEYVSQEALHAAIADTRDPVTKIKIVGVVICRLRQKLARQGIEITTIHGLGYSLEKTAREKIHQLLARSSGVSAVGQSRPELNVE
jgi:biotin operon repressor